MYVKLNTLLQNEGNMINLLFLLIFGLIVGFVGGYAGIGGAPFLIVFLSIFMGMSQHSAQGTVLAVMLGPMSLLGILTMTKRVKPMLKYAIIGVLSYAVCSYFGAYFAFLVDSSKLKFIFSAFVFIIGINEIFGFVEKSKYLKRLDKKNVNLKNVALVSIIVGTVGGFFGIGAGILMTPIFVGLFGMKKDDARLLSLLILLPPVSLGAVIKYHMEGAVVWQSALIIFFAYFITNYFGSKLALKHSAQKFKTIYGYILIAISIFSIVTIS